MAGTTLLLVNCMLAVDRAFSFMVTVIVPLPENRGNAVSLLAIRDGRTLSLAYKTPAVLSPNPQRLLPQRLLPHPDIESPIYQATTVPGMIACVLAKFSN